MILFKKAMPLSAHVNAIRKQGQTIGFVPTMGALHNGHLALIDACKKGADVTVCSIFVNPMQFNNAADFKKYPNTIEQDIERLLQAGCDILFLPGTAEMYPDDFVSKHYDLGTIETVWEGKYRPGHFQGVCQAVDRLLTIIQPHQLYLGQKDYQQCMVLKKLLALTGRNDLSLHIIPTKREKSGLALSSRNLRLTKIQREKAAALYQTLGFLKSSLLQKTVPELQEEGKAFLEQSGFVVDYVAVADAHTLYPAEAVETNKVVGLIAATIGEIRLIDNLMLN